MTGRGRWLLFGGAAAAAAGWSLSWPELTGAGAGLVVLVVVVRGLAGRRPRGTLQPPTGDLRVVRGTPAAARLGVVLRRRRLFLAVVEGDSRAPSSSVRVPRRGPVPVTLDTASRGVRPVGPWVLLQADPWGIVRREVDRTRGGTLTVLPRTLPVRRELTTTRSSGDSELATRRQGDQHFHALREYVLGDEPRQVHWRSSARAGRLVVRQQVSAASVGTVVVLDLDETAYARAGAFSTGFDQERFELAVEMAASLVTSRLQSVEQVQLLLTRRGASPVLVSEGRTAHALDVLAAVTPAAPVETAVEELPARIRRTSCAHLLLVTGTPSTRTTGVLRRLVRLVPSTRVLRAAPGPGARPALPGLVLDVERLEQLA